jgi:hypothetical protein
VYTVVRFFLEESIVYMFLTEHLHPAMDSLVISKVLLMQLYAATIAFICFIMILGMIPPLVHNASLSMLIISVTTPDPD